MMLGSGALQKKPALSYCKAGLYGWWDCVGTLAGNFENNRRAHSYFSMKILNLYLVFHGNTADYLFSKSTSARLIYKVSFHTFLEVRTPICSSPFRYFAALILITPIRSPTTSIFTYVSSQYSHQ